MSDPTSVPSFDETGAAVSGDGDDTENIDLEDGNLGKDADLAAEQAAAEE